MRFLAQFNNALIYFLLAAAVAAWVLGHRLDAAVIVAVVTINAIVGFLQEGKAEKALSAIRRMIAPRATVRRDGRRASVAVAEIVPGDLVLLEAGDRVPADLRLLRARALLIDEAMLTGESVAAAKQEAPVAPDTAARRSPLHGFLRHPGRRRSGHRRGRGDRRAHRNRPDQRPDRAVEPLTTPLLRQINQFGRRFTWMTLSRRSCCSPLPCSRAALPGRTR